MNYVLDSCVGFKWLVVEQDTDKARKLRDEYRQAIHELFAPDVFPVEVAHALTRAERQGRITPAEGAQLMTDHAQHAPATLPVASAAAACVSDIVRRSRRRLRLFE